MRACVRACVLFFALLCVPLVASADIIDSFASDIRVNKDGSADVTETILYDFGTEEHHGIYRDIPAYYLAAQGEKRRVEIDNITVVDENMSPYMFESFGNGDTIRIKIGDPDVLITGKHTYEISYTAHDVVGFFSDHDEIYWNVTGDDWRFPITQATARVYAPASTTGAACYIGPYGANQDCGAILAISGDGSALLFKAGRALNIEEGFTVGVGWPKGYTIAPTSTERAMGWIELLWPFFVPLVAGVWLFRRWYAVGRDERGRGTIIPEYDAPENVSPALMYEIVHERMSSSVISALIIDLAVKGYLKIHREENKTLGIFKSVSYRFEKLKARDSSLSLEAVAVYDALFKDRDSATDEELKSGGDLIQALTAATNAVGAKVVADGYFKANPSTVRMLYIVAGVVTAFVGFVFTGVLSHGMFIPAFIVTGVLIAGFGLIMPAKTKKGALTKERILGLKEYLQIAEKNRLDFHNAPEKSPELFEKLLPYAMVLGVSAAWAKEFEDMQRTPPTWYEGGSYAAFTPVAFADDMNSMGSVVGTLSSPTSGSGGSGGGGFSGGGFGGGGGGSW